MSLPSFFYSAPKTIDEFWAMMELYRGRCKVLAGGTDVLVRMKARTLTPRYLIDIKGIRSLAYIGHDVVEGLRVGAATTLRTIENSDLVRHSFPSLSESAHLIGSVQIRNRGTVAGNLCNASPSADMAPSLIALDASLRISKRSGDRIVSLEDFFLGPGQTVVEKDEIVTEIRVPNAHPWTGVVYRKHSVRKAMDLAIVGVAAKITIDDMDKKCIDPRIVLGAVGPRPMRAKRAEEVLSGRVVDDRLIEMASAEAASECRPISDVRSSAGYRKEMVRVFVKRAVEGAMELALSSPEVRGTRGRS